MTYDTENAVSPPPDWGFDTANFWSLGDRLVPCGPASLLTAVDLKHRLLWWSHQDQAWCWVPQKDYSARFAEIAAWRSIASSAADAITSFLSCEKGDPEADRNFTRMMTIQDTFTTLQGYRCAWEGGWLYRSLLLDHRWLLRDFTLPKFDEYIFSVMVLTASRGHPSEYDVSLLQRDPVVAAMPSMYEYVFPLSWKTGILLGLKGRGISATVAYVNQGIERASEQGQFTQQQAKDLKAHHGSLLGEAGRNTTDAVTQEVVSAWLDASEHDRPATSFVLPTVDRILKVSAPVRT